MDEIFILQVAIEIGLAGGAGCVAFELHRAWLDHGVDARVLTSQTTEPEARPGISLVASWLKQFGNRFHSRHLAALFAVRSGCSVTRLCTLAFAKKGLATTRNYAWEEIGQQYLRLFEELIAEPTRSVRSLAAPNPIIPIRG